MTPSPSSPGVAKTYRFSARLDDQAPNSQQGKTASATCEWDSVQRSGESTVQQ